MRKYLGVFGNRSFVGLGVFLLAIAALPLRAQVDYTPYNFTTIAGVASIGSNDGTNRVARFNNPEATASDSAGNIYVADSGNHVIRKMAAVGTNWVVTTIAGLPGNPGSADGTNSAAQFYYPAAVAVDNSGNVFVADSANYTIRKIAPLGTNWVVTTIAGVPGYHGSSDGTNTDALFFYPEGLAFDSSGHLFVGDSSNNSIRKMTPVGTNWVVTTIAGSSPVSGSNDGTNGFAHFNQPCGLAVDAAGSIFVADYFNSTIRKITSAGTNWLVTTIAGKVGVADSAEGTGTNAVFNYPHAVAVDTNGNVFVADSENYTIRKLTPSGTNYVVSTPIGQTRASNSTDGTNNAARFWFLLGISIDKAGNLLVADTQNSEIRKIAPVGTNYVVTTLAGFAQNVGGADGTNAVARFNSPRGIAVDAAGNVFVADQNNNTIRKLTPVGTNWAVTTIAGQAGMAYYGDGNGTNAYFNYPAGIAVDASGNLFVTDAGNHVIRKLTPTATNYLVTTIAGSAAAQAGSTDGTNANARFFIVDGITVDAAGNLFVADNNNCLIRKIAPVGTNWITTTIAGKLNSYDFADGVGTNILFNQPTGIAVGKGGVVYVVDMGNNMVRKLTPNGTNYVSSTVAAFPQAYGFMDGTNSDARFAYPTGIAIDTNDTLYVTDQGNNTIRKVTPLGTNWMVTTLAGIHASTGSADGAGSAALFNGPFGIAIDKTGNLFVADLQNSSIRKGSAITVIELDMPFIAGGQLQVPFLLKNGFASSFKLLQASQPGGPYTTNSTATLSTVFTGTAFKFAIPVPAASRFYRVQTP
ncbi:NHL repeat containing protein [Pedosphaera parvula]|uniref:NHL repeat containing protein n=1 Tax=Pedosphaera parvula (strain Ellin514) TaxID=320771 RepID=B9XQ81_PEDPL|nr:NHL repeat containing protein [Pedosphaera parvula]EEF57999.1 NHL repeat containing protein [Pedosphaera parvula Ellin514]